MADPSSVEIKITGTLDPSVTASTKAASTELDRLGQSAKVSAKTMSDALRAAGGDVSRITPEMVGLADATAKVAPAATAAATAEATLSRAHVSSRAATESLVIVHEALQGRLNRIPGSMMILAQAATGASSGLLFLGAAIVGTVGLLAYLGVKALEAANAIDKIHLAGLGTQGFAASEQQIRSYIKLLDALPQVSSEDAQKIVATFQTMENRSAASIQGLSAATTAWAELTGQSYDKAAEGLAKVFGEPATNQARQFLVTLRGVTTAQVEAYDKAKTAGDVYGMQGAMLAALSGTITRSRAELDRHAASVHTNWRNTGEWILLVQGGMSAQEADNAMLAEKTRQYDNLSVAIRRSIDALKTQQKSPQELLTTALIDADTVDTARVRVEDLKAKVKEFQAQLNNPTATEGMKANFRSAIAAANAEITSLQNKQAFRGTGFNNAGQEAIAQARETISEINADQTRGDAERRAEIQATYQKLLADKKLNKAQIIEMHTAMNKDLAAEDRRAASEKRQIDQNAIQTDLEISRTGMQQKKSDLEQQVADGVITKRQELSQLIPIVEAERDAQLKAIADTQQGYAKDSVFFREKENEKRVIVAQSEADIAAIRKQYSQQAAREQLATERSMYQQLSSVEGTFVSQMFSGRVGLFGSLRAAGLQFVEQEIQDDLRYFTARLVLSKASLASDQAIGHAGLLLHAATEGEKTTETAAGTAARTGLRTTEAAADNAGFLARAARWVAMELGMTTVTTTSEATRAAAKTAALAAAKAEEATMNVASAESYAGVAAAAAASAVAGIPIVGPALAVAAAASTFASLQPYAALAALDVGAYDVPQDMPAYIHAGEMVVPKTFASGLRQSISGGTNVFGGDTNSTSVGGDHIEIHMHGVDHAQARANGRDLVNEINYQRRIRRLKK